MFLYPYMNGSGSVKNLKAALQDQLLVIRREGSRFKGRADKVVINWGCSNLPEEVMKCNVVNHPAAVALAANKLDFFTQVEGLVNIPDFTVDRDVAQQWVEEGNTIFARSKLNGHSGEGITIIETATDWNNYNHEDAKIYVMYIPKKDEYRIHVCQGEVIDMQRKAVRRGEAHGINFKVRNHQNGFIFVREGVEPPEQVLEQARLAVEHCGLDFGAVDVIWNNHRGKAYVLEVNTAPGLEGSSVETYAEALQQALPRRPQNLEQIRAQLFENAVRGQPINLPDPFEPEF